MDNVLDNPVYKQQQMMYEFFHLSWGIDDIWIEQFYTAYPEIAVDVWIKTRSIETYEREPDDPLMPWEHVAILMEVLSCSEL